MFNKYFLVQLCCNMSDGISQSIEAFDNEKNTLDKFYDKLSQYGGNPQTKYFKLLMLSPNGNVIKIEEIDNARFIVPETSPIEEETEVTEEA